jgi:hypothetical protein
VVASRARVRMRIVDSFFSGGATAGSSLREG